MTATTARTFTLPGVRFDDLGPQRVIVFHHPKTRLHAVVVLDTKRDVPSGGGTRLAPDVSLAEVARLARAMTLKYALLSMPVGGAKAGIVLDPADPGRSGVVRAFVEAIRPLVESGTFVPGADMGTSAEDFASLLPFARDAGLSEDLTGYGVVAAAKAACALAGRSLEGSRIALEGFGKVGTAAARFFAREGARIVAVSTVLGAIHDPTGLDVEALIALREAHGDAGLAQAPGARPLARDSLFTVPCDVLVPGARPDVIHDGNAHLLEAKLVVPGSNIPYAEGTPATLDARGVLAIPDFVSNAGGVLATVAALQGMSGDAARSLVQAAIENNVRRVVERARRDRTSPVEAATRIAREALAT